ncbi:MAG: bifunctional biotin--[acetyl-CoA-carboxylase] ligase/biotin operon repressor BirA [Endozoicomonas sp. (ex Botrylloides leachii)]|nr:bifunctional biotin--[acetyl-CoA-carboxylase] ligase/biotin operon repressor BirA [Endozoicomonas sp. (ex Botrylloides leachii)]
MEKLLRLLADRELHSGEEIGRLLNISRAAVWKKIKNLQALGLQLDVIRGKGYRLASGVELLDSTTICNALDKTVLNNTVLHTCLITESTNDLICTLANRSFSNKIQFCTAEHQTRGRGRRARQWSNPFGGAICLSALWCLGEGTASLEGLSLAVGLGVLQALTSCGATELGLKWPNDILWQGRKLAGVLLEVHGDPTGDCQVVIGIGVNIKLTDKQLATIDQPAVDLATVCGQNISRNRAISAIINALYHILEGYKVKGFSMFRDQWCQHDIAVGQEVTLDASEKKVRGRALGISEGGGIILETDKGCRVFHGGEISLRIGG